MRAKKRTGLFGAAAACLTLLAGCETSPQAVREPDVVAVELGGISEMLDTRRPLAAMEAIETLVRTGQGNRQELDLLRGRGLDLTREELGVAIREGRMERSRSLIASLRSLGQPAEVEGKDWSDASLMAEAVRVSRAKQLRVLAAYYGFRYASLVGLPATTEAERADFARLLAELKDPAALQEARRQAEAAGLHLGADLPAAPPSSSALAEPTKGTVTVLVDKGIKVTNRVGTLERALGSGFFVDPSGYVMTNYHVISSEVDPKYEGYSRLYVMRTERPTERVPAKVVGYDETLDLAILKAEIEADYAYYPGLAVDLHPGDRVLAIGSPASLESTVNSGIVSAVGRRFLQIGDVVQVDVPVNPGNSGGPLLDSDLRLAGVVFAGLEQYEGLNFAIPTRWIERVLPRLFDGGQVSYAWLGASVVETDAGLEVIYTLPGGPAARVGILEGDVLERVEGSPVPTIADAQAVLMEHAPPVLARLEWRRGEEQLSALVALEDRPLSPVVTALEKDTRERLIYVLFGMKLEKIGKSLGRTHYVVRKVLPGSQAAEIGLAPDDPLTVEAWKVDKEQKLVSVNMSVAKKSSGYLEGVVQLTTYLETDSFL